MDSSVVVTACSGGEMQQCYVSALNGLITFLFNDKSNLLLGTRNVCQTLPNARTDAKRYDATFVYIKEFIRRQRNAIAGVLFGSGSGLPQQPEHAG